MLLPANNLRCAPEMHPAPGLRHAPESLQYLPPGASVRSPDSAGPTAFEQDRDHSAVPEAIEVDGRSDSPERGYDGAHCARSSVYARPSEACIQNRCGARKPRGLANPSPPENLVQNNFPERRHSRLQRALHRGAIGDDDSWRMTKLTDRQSAPVARDGPS